MTIGLPDEEKTRLGVVTPLHMLAFDHRASFTRGLFGIEGTPSSEQRRRIADSKLLIFEGLQQAVISGAPAANAYRVISSWPTVTT